MEDLFQYLEEYKLFINKLTSYEIQRWLSDIQYIDLVNPEQYIIDHYFNTDNGRTNLEFIYNYYKWIPPEIIELTPIINIILLPHMYGDSNSWKMSYIDEKLIIQK